LPDTHEKKCTLFWNSESRMAGRCRGTFARNTFNHDDNPIKSDKPSSRLS